MAAEGTDYFRRRGVSMDLVVFIHGLRANPRHPNLSTVYDAIDAAPGMADADLFVPDLPFGIFSRARPPEVVARILSGIDRRWRESLRRGSPYRRIYLVGHSMGGLFIRKVYVCASGSHPDAPIEPEYHGALREADAADACDPRPWASRVERIVLVAALNRGWTISHHLGLLNAARWSLGSFGGWVTTLFSRTYPILFSIRRGRPFVTQLRIQWIRMRQRVVASGGAVPGGAVTIQLLGSVDDLVSPDDSIDVVAGRDFYYFDVPFSDHGSVLRMGDDDEHSRDRRQLFITALTAPEADLTANTTPPVDEELVVHDDVTDVVFVIHGIRDVGYWTEKISRRTKMMGKAQNPERNVASETSTYGYFPMLPFIWPRTRRKKVEWLMDEYAEAVARYPQARFAYMGHSNGTYMLARALQDYPATRFTNVVFVGSVVTTDYDWKSHIESGRIGAVLNYTASADAVVAFFPKLFQRPRLRWQDLGSAGHDGFDQAGSMTEVRQLGPIPGGHSAARNETEWNTIATFLLDGHDATTEKVASHRNRIVAFLGFAPIIVWLILAAIVTGIGLLIWQIPTEWLRAVVLLLYGGVLWKILTRI